MATLFERTTRSLDRDRPLAAVGSLLVGSILLAVWLAWLVLAEVPVHVASSTARVEVDQVAHPIQSQLDGRVIAVHVGLGASVERGEPIAELDAQTERLQLDEAVVALAATARELAAVHEQLKVEQAALELQEKDGLASQAEAQARVSEARVASRRARSKRTQVEYLANRGLVPDTERLDARADAEQRAASATALRRSADGVAARSRLSVVQRRSTLEALERQAVVLEGKIATTEATKKRLEHALEQRIIRSPVSGVVVELDALTYGTRVSADTPLGVVLPPGGYVVVAEFPPAQAIGRIREGQPVLIRLDGFPWAQHGSVEGRVVRAAGEIRDETVRVEIEITKVGPTISLQHGLPGSTEIELERTSPATLLLRAAGRALVTSGEPAMDTSSKTAKRP